MGRLGDEKYYPPVLYESEHYRIEEFVRSLEVSQKMMTTDKVLQLIKYLVSFSCSYK